MNDWKKKDLGLDDSKFNIYLLEGTSPEWNDQTIARLLSLNEPFLSDIEESRDKLKIKFIDSKSMSQYFRPTISNLGALRLIQRDLTQKLDKALSINASKLLSKYKLGYRWLFSLEILILTDVMFLPMTNPIELSVQNVAMDYYTDSNNDNDTTVVNKYRLLNDELLLTLKISEKVSKNKLANFIKSHSDIDELLELLNEPAKPRAKVEQGTMTWGYHIWLIKKNPKGNVATWDDVVEELIKLDTGLEVPDRLSAETYYKRFLKSLESYNPD